MSETRLILHIKGTESQTTELPRQVVRAAIAKGQLTHSQLIWSVAENAWKQVRELPHLLPSQKLAPAPVPRVATGPLAKIDPNAVPRAKTGPVPRVASGPLAKVDPNAVPRAKTGPVPRVSGSAPAAGTTATPGAVSAKKSQSLTVKDDDHHHPLKWLCIGLGLVVFLTLGFNYLMVDAPLAAHLGQTPYSKVTVYAHLGAYVQPSVMVIHVRSSSTVDADHLPEFLVALAHSTPQSPVTNSMFERVALTSGWMGQYSFSGYAWKQLGEMGQDDYNQQKEFIMNQLCDAGGQPVVPASTLNAEAQAVAHEQIWKTFAAQFSQP